MIVMKKRNEAGFTLIEMTLAIVILIILGTFFILQRNDLKVAQRDQQRKQTINTVYYALKEVFYKEHHYYPRAISRDNLPMVDPTLFTDPHGFTLHGDQCNYTKNGKQESNGNCDYKYSPLDCDNEGKCQAFKLRSEMEHEAAFEREDSHSKSTLKRK